MIDHSETRDAGVARLEDDVVTGLVGIGLVVLSIVVGVLIGSLSTGGDDEGGLQGLLIGGAIGLAMGGAAVGAAFGWRGLSTHPVLVYLATPPGTWAALLGAFCAVAGLGRELLVLGLLSLVPSVGGAALGKQVASWARRVRRPVTTRGTA